MRLTFTLGDAVEPGWNLAPSTAIRYKPGTPVLLGSDERLIGSVVAVNGRMVEVEVDDEIGQLLTNLGATAFSVTPAAAVREG